MWILLPPLADLFVLPGSASSSVELWHLSHFVDAKAGWNTKWHIGYLSKWDRWWKWSWPDWSDKAESVLFKLSWMPCGQRSHIWATFSSYRFWHAAPLDLRTHEYLPDLPFGCCWSTGGRQAVSTNWAKHSPSVKTGRLGGVMRGWRARSGQDEGTSVGRGDVRLCQSRWTVGAWSDMVATSPNRSLLWPARTVDFASDWSIPEFAESQ